MFKQCLEVFDGCSTDVSAYTEIVVDVSSDAAFAIDAIIGQGGVGEEAHRNLLDHFGLNERQLPRLLLGPGLKGQGDLFTDS